MSENKFDLEKLEELEKKEEQKASTDKEFKVLCVDDEEINLKSLSNLLSDHYKVYVALSAKEAKAILMDNPVDVIITDQRMPETVGTDFLKDLVENNMVDNIRIILTGYTDINDLIQCINDGLIDRYLMKPWNSEELLQVVEQAIEKLKAKRELEAFIPQDLLEKVFPSGVRELPISLNKKKSS